MKFSYNAFDQHGKATSSTIEAGSLAEATESLRRQGFFIGDIREASESTAAPAARKSKKVSAGKRLKHLAMFSRQLHVLISSGTPIVQALSAIERQSDDPAWTDVITQLRARVEQGTPLFEAMRHHGQHFDAVSRSLVAAGESSGNLPLMLDRLAVLARKQLHLRSTIAGAMIYPCVLIGLGITVLIVMLLFVLPRFAMLFQNLDSPLPPTTKFLMFLSGMLRSYWWAILIGVIGAVFGLRMWLASENGKRAVHSLSLSIPKLDKLTRSLMTARLARMLGTLLESRVPLLDALQLTKQSAANVKYVELIARAEDAVGRGEPISAVLSSSELISPCVQEAVRNGETSGQLGAPLMHMADFLDEENDIVVKSLTSIIEPVILILLGLVVGFIAISMFLPLFDLVSATHG